MPQSTYSLAFDGTLNQDVSVPSNAVFAIGTGDFSLSFWAKIIAGSEAIYHSAVFTLGSFFGGNSISVTLTNGGTTNYLWAGGILLGTAMTATGTGWHHFCYVRSGTTGYIYVDGVQATSGSLAGAASISQSTILIGGGGIGTAAYQVNGSLDDVALLNTALTAARIASLAAGTTNPLALSPVGLWRMEEGSGTNVADTSGNADDGTITGSGITWSTSVPYNLTDNVLFDAVSNSGVQTASSAYNWNHTCTFIAGGFLAVDIALLSAGATVTSAKYNSVGMTFLGARSTTTSFGRIECWGIVNPTKGTNVIAVAFSSSIKSAGFAVSYANVDQTTPTEGFNSNQATNVGAADATVDVTSVADQDWIHAAVATDDSSITANQTNRNNVTDGVSGSGADEDFGPQSPALKTMSFTNVGALATWAIAGYAIRPINTPSADTLFAQICL